MGKQMLYIRKDIEPLFKQEKNKSKLVSDLLTAHYSSAPVGGEEVADTPPEATNFSPMEPVPVTKRDEVLRSPVAIDGRIETFEGQHIDGRIEFDEQSK